MGLLDGQLQTTINNAMSFVMLDITLTQKTDADPSDYTPGTGVTATETAYSCKGFVEDDVQRYLDTGIITQGERVVTILQGSLSVTPQEGDEVTVRGATSIINEVGQDPAQATWVLGVTP